MPLSVSILVYSEQSAEGVGDSQGDNWAVTEDMTIIV